MKRVICTVAVYGLLLAGCASQSSNEEGPDGDPVPAPVREASIVAPEDPAPVLAQSDSLPEAVVDTLVQEEPHTPEPPVAEPVVAEVESPGFEPAIEVAQVIEADPVSTAEEESVSDSTVVVESAEEAEVEGLVQLALPEDEIVVATGEEGSESEVATYLLDEAEKSFERENYEKARGQAERALTLEPSAGRAYLILARTAMAENDLNQAAEIAKTGLVESGDSVEIFEQLNQILGEIAEMPAQEIRGEPNVPADQEPVLEPPTTALP